MAQDYTGTLPTYDDSDRKALKLDHIVNVLSASLRWLDEFDPCSLNEEIDSRKAVHPESHRPIFFPISFCQQRRCLSPQFDRDISRNTDDGEDKYVIIATTLNSNTSSSSSHQ
jgi:hypothetical protein